MQTLLLAAVAPPPQRAADARVTWNPQGFPGISLGAHERAKILVPGLIIPTWKAQLTRLFTFHCTADGAEEAPFISSTVCVPHTHTRPGGHGRWKEQLTFGADPPRVALYLSIVQTLNGRFLPSFLVCSCVCVLAAEACDKVCVAVPV